jgi:hypothetical protein
MSKPLTSKFILRTLERMKMVTRYDAKTIADLLLKNKHRAINPQFLGTYLDDVSQLMGRDSNAHPHGPCDECGGSISLDHNGARFCSNACRQKSYRKRVTLKPDRNCK